MPELELDVTVRQALARQLKVSPEELTVDTDLEALGLNDDALANGVLLAVEDALDVRFPDDFFDGLHTVGEFTSAVRIAVGV